MKPSNLASINEAFTSQAERFDTAGYHLSKSDYLAYMIGKVKPESADDVLEVAAGTCICGRAFAPYVNHVVCLDATEAMLEEGQKECRKADLRSITLIKGYAEELPFLDNTFDIVLSRLAFHHMTDYGAAFREMARVVKPGGKLVLIDLVPGDEEKREQIDSIEKMRDPSHEHDLTKKEMRKLYEDNNISLVLQEQTEIPVSLEGWMALTKTDDKIKDRIRAMMKEDLSGPETTGFHPYVKDGEIFFNHHWVLNIGRKTNYHDR